MMNHLRTFSNRFAIFVGCLACSPVYSMENTSLVVRENINLVINGKTAYSLLQAGQLQPLYEMSIEEDESLKLDEDSVVMVESGRPAKPKEKLVGYKLEMSSSAGLPSLNVRCVRDRNTYNLKIYSSSDKPAWIAPVPSNYCYDQIVEVARRDGVIAGYVPNILEGKKGLVLESETEVSSGEAILYSRGPIDLVSTKLHFQNTLMTTPTGIYMSAHATLGHPFVKEITVDPKIFYYTLDNQTHQSRTVCLKGNVNFESGEFDLKCTDVEAISITFTESLLDSFREAFSSSSGLQAPRLGATKDVVEALYKKALGYRDGKDGLPKDPAQAKATFTQIISQYGSSYPAEYSKSLHNLGNILHDEGLFTEAEDSYRKAASLGLEQSQQNIWKMQITKKISASPEERFFAICDLHKYKFPLEREYFRFGIHKDNLDNAGTLKIGSGGIHYQTIHNSGSLSSPVIWVEQENGLKNSGKITAQLLIVGQKRIESATKR
jgi:tetratricopeptide (TPR) repeat protein